MPAIDVNTFADWTENDINMYQALPFWLAQIQVDRMKTYPTFKKIVNKHRKWKQNMGPVMRGVKTNPSPNLRQFAFPKPISLGQPLTDVMNITESIAEAQVCRHRFQSPVFNFYPDFNDFLSHIEDNGKDIMDKIERFGEMFLRGMMFHMAPFVLACQADGTVKLINTAHYSGTGLFTEGVSGKTSAEIQAIIAQTTGNLQMQCLTIAATIAETDLRIPFFKGTNVPKEDAPLDGKYLFVMDSEAWNWFPFDPYLQANKVLDFDYAREGYRGSFFGRAVSRLEDLPMRFQLDGTYEAPELRVDSAGEYNDGETEPNPDYTGLGATQSPIGVAWLIGENGYEDIDSGPPPSEFTGDKFPDAPAMHWNGEVKLTKNFLLKGLDATGAVEWSANEYGEYCKFISQATFGIVPSQRRNCIPIFYQRKRGAN